MTKNIDKSKEQLIFEIEKVKERNNELEKSEIKCKQIEKDLHERIKELNCFYGISKVLENRDLSIYDVLQNVVNLIPDSWHYPEIACSKINFKGENFFSDNSLKFCNGIHKQISDIVVDGKVEGYVCVCYFEQKFKNDECPFLKEEYKLLEAIANKLGYFIENNQTKFDNEQRMKSLINSTPDIICLKDGKGRWLIANDADLELFSLTNVKYFGKTDSILAEFTDPIYRESFLSCEKTDEIAWEKRQVIRCQEVIPKNDGTEKILDVVKVPLFETDGRRKSLIVVSRDITEQKLAQEELRKERIKYNILFEKSSIPFLILHPSKGVIDVNDATLDLFGYGSKEKMLGLTFENFSPQYQYNQQLSEAKYNENRNKIINNKHLSFDWLFKDIFAKEFFAKVTCNLIELDGDEVFQFAIQDISKEREAEQLQKILYNISNASSIEEDFDVFMNIIRENISTIIDTKNFYTALYDGKTDTISLVYFDDEKDIITSIPAGKTLTNYVIKTKKPLLATKQKKCELEKLGEIERFQTDSEVWLGVPLKIKGKVTGVITVQSYTDKNAFNESDMKMLEFVSEQISISVERKHNEKIMKEKNLELIEAKERAEESDRLKSAFLANMSHEIRTPMNGILGFSELLKEPEISSDEQMEYVNIIEKSGLRMLNIINDLIDISKVEANQMEVVISETNINQQLEYLYVFFKPEVEKKGMKFFLKKTLADDEVIINTDKEKIYAILTNLIKNAIKYSKEGSIEFGYEKKNDFFEFFVKDTGIGIAENKLQVIFGRFIQADLTLSKDFEGAGLGLAITKAYVEMLNGKIWVESELGKGSVFYFKIPIIQK